MDREGLMESFLERPVLLVYIISLLLILIALESRLYANVVFKRVNLTSTSSQFVSSLLSARVLANMILMIIYFTLLVGSIIRAVIRFVEPENPIDLKVALSTAAIATLIYFLFDYLAKDLIVLVVGRITVDMSGVTDADTFRSALEDALNSRASIHPLAAKVLIGMSIASIGVYLGAIRYLIYKVRGNRVAMYVVLFIFMLILIGVVRWTSMRYRHRYVFLYWR